MQREGLMCERVDLDLRPKNAIAARQAGIILILKPVLEIEISLL